VPNAWSGLCLRVLSFRCPTNMQKLKNIQLFQPNFKLASEMAESARASLLSVHDVH
jgi:hypothetical protein